MRWYKRSVVFAIGLFLELIIAVISCFLIKQNHEWLASLALPYFAPRSFLLYGAIMEIVYLSVAASLALYTAEARDLIRGISMTAIEGIAEISTLLFFFRFTYEITAFFLATITMVLFILNTMVFLAKNDAAGIVRLPALAATIYLWAVIYCILMINFA